MGSNLFGGKQTSKSESEPWKAQQPFIKDAFASAQSNYDAKKGIPFYEGDLYAKMNGTTKAGLDGTVDYASGTGATNANLVGSTGAGILSSAAGNWGSAIDAYGKTASTDPTQGNIASAGLYAKNPFLDGQIDAASRDVTRNLSENVMPSIDRAATATGNINSTRAGVAEGIAQRGAQDQIGDIASSMRSDAYQSGLSLAESGRQANMGAQGNTAGLYGSMYGAGADAIGSGQNLSYQNLENRVNAGKMEQADAQGQLDANYQKWQGNDARANDLLKQYYSIIGANNWGGTSTTTQSANPGLIAGIMGAASSGAGLYASLSKPGAK